MRGEGSLDNAIFRAAITPLNWFEIPYRCMVPNGVEGLLVEGCTISQLHRADMWTRGMYCCMVTGQAAGTAAALAARTGVLPRHIEIAALQENLASQGIDLGSRSQGSPQFPPLT